MIFALGEDNKIYRWVHHGGTWERFWRDAKPAETAPAPLAPQGQMPTQMPAQTPPPFAPQEPVAGPHLADTGLGMQGGGLQGGGLAG